MKTYGRIYSYTEFNYPRIAIQIYKRNEGSQYNFSIIGTIVFTKYKDAYNCIQYKVDADHHNAIFEMAKLAKYIDKNADWNADIREVVSLIGLVEIKEFAYNLIPVSESGNHVFQCFDRYPDGNGNIQVNSSAYTSVYAPNMKMAEKIAKKYFPKFDFEIVQLKRIELKYFNFDNPEFN